MALAELRSPLCTALRGCDVGSLARDLARDLAVVFLGMKIGICRDLAGIYMFVSGF